MLVSSPAALLVAVFSDSVVAASVVPLVADSAETSGLASVTEDVLRVVLPLLGLIVVLILVLAMSKIAELALLASASLGKMQ